MAPEQSVAILAEAQFGLITRTQALALGLTNQQITYRLGNGRWKLVHRNVYRINGAARSWAQDAMGACLWAGDSAALSHQAAARVWEFNSFQRVGIEISTVAPKRDHDVPFRVHRVSTALSKEIVTASGLPTTSVRRTILDLTGIRHPRSEGVLDQALARDLTSLGQMWLLYEEEWTKGRRGIAILKARLSERTPGRGPDDSELEFLLDKIIREYALPEPKRQYSIALITRGIRVDYCYPEARLIIEVDGYAFHGNRSAFDSDRERDAELQAGGWRVLRFTWAQLKWRRDWVADMIRRNLQPSGSGTSIIHA